MRVVALFLTVGLLGAIGLGGCSTCEDDNDCLILCDCDGDGEDDSWYAHDCGGGGVCTGGYDQDVRKGCEVLCEEDLSE